MTDYSPEPIAVVGLSAIMPDAPNAATFWENIKSGRYSITEVPPQRWDPALYYDPDPRVPDRTYSKIGGWVREFVWDPMAWRLPIPPRVAEQLDGGQKWAVAGARAALLDAGWPGWGVDSERVGVILGNAIGGDKHYATSMRIQFPEFARELSNAHSFAALPEAVRSSILDETNKAYLEGFPSITEDTMPGELSNVLAGRIANLFNFRGPNFTTDAACASGLAAIWAAIHGLNSHQYDAVVTGGIDRNMSVTGFVKFCKIGALSATGTRPFDAGADGFVMGEGAAIFVLKRLADAERDGDRIYAVLLGIAGSSDGKGKSITAPNPVGQRVAVEHAWRQAGVSPATASAVEAHGTSTRVGDASELESLTSVFLPAGAGQGSIALSSVKSNIGHLKAAAGAAGLFKMIMSLHEKTLPPSLNFADPNPNIDWARSPFVVNTELREWPVQPAGVRRGGVSAFGFGGTNFHAVLEEYVPGLHQAEGKRTFAAAAPPHQDRTPATVASRPPARGALVVGGSSDAEIVTQLQEAKAQAEAGSVPEPTTPDPSLAGAQVRLAIDYGEAAELAAKTDKALKAFGADNPAMWKMLRSQGVFLGRGRAPKVAFLYTGQGSQYANMLKSLRDTEPIVEETFAAADEIMTPLLGRPLSSYIFVDTSDPEAVKRLDQHLLQTEITQPAVLTADLALTRLLAAHGVAPNMVMGHSLGEYGALVAAGALDFHAALEAVSARGREMAHLQVGDNGAMAAVFAPLAEIERIVAESDGYAVVANVNSNNQAVVGGDTDAVERLIARFQAAGFNARRIPVSHAFHTSIVAPASKPLMDALRRLDVHAPRLPIVSNVTGAFYPENADVDTILDLLGRQVASPVQFVKGLNTLYDAGARVFVEVGPKKALHGFAEEVLGSEHDDVLALFTNHPKLGDAMSFNHALCGLYAAGFGLRGAAPAGSAYAAATSHQPVTTSTEPVHGSAQPSTQGTEMTTDRYLELGRLFADFLEQGRRIYAEGATPTSAGRPVRADEPVVITGAALGLPGVERVFDDDNIRRILEGQQFIDTIPHRFRRAMVDMHITRLVKRESGDPTFETIDDEADVIKLAGRSAPFDAVAEFGVEEARDQALDAATRLAIGAGFDALRDAGIPLALHYKTTTVGTQLPDRWGLPGPLRDDTGVIFASAFPAYDAFAGDLQRYFTDRGRREQLAALEAVRARMRGDEPASPELDRRIHDLRRQLETEPYRFDRRFLFRCLSMGHSQFAEIIGARGPNTQLNAACASTTQALCVAEDWIRTGRCQRVIVVSADDATSDTLLPWLGSGFLASGAAATDDVIEDAAIPFDRRRHGLIIGMGAAAFVVEAAEAARERGIQPICEVLGAVTANSAFHGTRLDLSHISQVMEQVMRQAEARGIDRRAIAPSTVFVSHETYTPARGGSASAEINALRTVFGPHADDVVITNTKGFTGHAMGAGIEEVVAIKALETGIVPPIPNFKETDPELGPLNLSKGGSYPVDYALRLAAGFGSQIAMALLHWTPMPDGQHRSPERLGYEYRIADEATWRAWLASVSGAPNAQLEVVQRRLRFVDGSAHGAAPAEPATAVPAAAAPVLPVAPAPATTVPAPATTAPTVDPAVAVSAPEEPAAAVPPPEAVAAEVPASAAVAAEVPVAAAASAADPITAAVVSIVSEMTGYPPDLLDLDLDLEADLGVDTVKQAEVFAAVRERFGVARDDTLQLRDFPTLAHVIGWVRERTGIPEGAAPAPEPATSAPTVEEAATTLAPEAVAAAVPTVESVAAAVRAPEPPSAADEVTDAVVSIVSEMTGYPPDLLDLDLDLEADLGVDTVKQAEVFAAVRERFGVARDDTLQLRDFPTLAHVIGWVRERTSTPETPPVADPAAETSVAEPSATVPAAATIAGDIEATQRYPRRVPVPVLRPDLALCKPTGFTLGKGSRVVVMLDVGGVGKSLVGKLENLGVSVLVLDPGIATDELLARLDGWLADGPVQGIYWLPALDREGPLTDMDLGDWREALRRRVKNLYAVARRLSDQAPFVVAATRLGGYHGYDDEGALAPLGGAVTGFVKAYKRERPEALVKAVDFPASRKTAALADVLVQETLRDPGSVEVGHAGGLRWTVGLEERPFGDGTGGLSLGRDTVFVVTGAAGSIVSAITADLAAASAGTFHLLDLTPAPDPTDPDLQRFATDRDGLRADIAARLKDRGERPTPVLIEKELARYERLNAALAAIQAIRDAGGRAYYHVVDLTDPEAVGRVMDEVHTVSGHVDVLLHAAGLDVSRFLTDKEPREYDLVFDVKSDGWFNVLRAAGDMPVGVTVAFSSIAGRFGNAGQTDYSAANDLLCKVASSFRRTRTETRAIALDWTAWGSIGMASRGSIPKIMEMAGIEMLAPAAGIAWIRRELTSSDDRGEFVVAGALGKLVEEYDDTGGLDPGQVRAQATGPMVGAVEAAGIHSGLVVRTTLDPKRQPFLNDHRIDGTAVLPGVMGVEGFAEVARLLVPRWHVTAVEDVNFLAPLKFYRDEPRTLTLRATIRRDGDDLLAACALEAERQLPGSVEPQRTTHFTASVRLTARPPARQHDDPVAEVGPAVAASDVYRLYFHGPAYQVISSAWRHDGGDVARLADGLPANHDPAELPTVLPPRLVELCFQAAGLCEAAWYGRLALPQHVDRVQVLGEPGHANGPLYAVTTEDDGHFDCAVLDVRGDVIVRVDGYRTSPLPGGLAEEVRRPLAAVISNG